jgi:hypothetical protein
MNPTAPVGGRENRSIRMWHLDEGAPDSTKERLRQTYLSALDAVDKVSARKADAVASGKFTEQGAADAVAQFALGELTPVFKRGRNVIDAARREANSLRDKIKLQPADKADVVGALHRREMREFLRTMPDKQRNEYISKRRDNMDPSLALAIVEMPAEFSGVLEGDRNDLIDRALQAQHGEAMVHLKELEEAIEIAASAVETGRDELRHETRLSPAEFDQRAAPHEQKDKSLWLKTMVEDGQLVVRYWDATTSAWPRATPEQIEAGTFYADRADYENAATATGFLFPGDSSSLTQRIV